MPNPKTLQAHHYYIPNSPYEDHAVMGRLGAGWPKPWSGTYDSMYGIGTEGIGTYTGVEMDSPRARISANAGSGRNFAPTTGEAAGPM